MACLNLVGPAFKNFSQHNMCVVLASAEAVQCLLHRGKLWRPNVPGGLLFVGQLVQNTMPLESESLLQSSLCEWSSSLLVSITTGIGGA